MSPTKPGYLRITYLGRRNRKAVPSLQIGEGLEDHYEARILNVGRFSTVTLHRRREEERGRNSGADTEKYAEPAGMTAKKSTAREDEA